MDQATDRQRFAGIDILRAIAASSVLLSHSIQVTTVLRSSWLQTHSPRLAELEQLFFVTLGHWGVGLFFVLSGFCIHLPAARALAKQPSYDLDLRQYYRRRITRIYPPHFVALVLSAELALLVPSQFFTISPITVPNLFQVVVHLLLLHSFFPSARYSINGVLWTIGIETHFYLFYPLLSKLRNKIRFEHIVWMLFGLAVVSKQIIKHIAPDYAYLWSINFVGRYWEWALGATVAEHVIARKAQPSKWSRFVLVLCASYGFSLVMALDKLPHSGMLNTYLSPLFFACALYLGARLPSLDSLAYRLSLEVGVQSYSLYLVHPIAISLTCVAMTALGMPLPLQWAACIVTSIVSMVVFFFTIERPFISASSPARHSGLFTGPWVKTIRLVGNYSLLAALALNVYLAVFYGWDYYRTKLM
jgi:peptidoglycan/LPS O-acetylase OafA/YrhL